jgi:serine/threonine-protein kinase
VEERPVGGNASAGTRTDVLLDGRYRLGPVLARGGMSTVHRAMDTRLDRPVAVKIMDPRLAADPAFRTRFEREARSAARINHPAVVDVHDQGTGEVAGEPVVFLVMELVEGGTLREVLAARGRLDLPSAVAVLRSVLAGLAEAHRRGLVHRDVKPENVLISRAGDVKVADFGLVTAVAQAGASHAGMIMGTVAYLSPEQVTSGSADARSDVYAAGVMLVELLTGAPPYAGDTPLSVAYRHVHDDVPPPSHSGIDVPAPIDDLVVRVTCRDPAERPADAATFLAALDQAAARAGVPSVPPPLPPPRVDDSDGPPANGPGPGGTRALSWPALPAPARPSPVSGKPLSGPETSPEWPYRRRRTGIIPAAVAAVVFLVVLAGAAAWRAGADRWTEVPSVVGVERAAAERLVVAADLVAAVELAHDDTVDAGFVAAVDPSPAAQLTRGSSVRLVVSTGPPVVPDIAAGTAVPAAERAVREAGLEPRRSRSDDEYSASVPAGTVIETDPPAGTELRSGGEVRLVVSRGPEPRRDVRVPLLLGRPADDAVDVLEDAGLRGELRGGFRLRDEDEAVVVRQSHGAGSLVERGTTVTLDAL